LGRKNILLAKKNTSGDGIEILLTNETLTHSMGSLGKAGYGQKNGILYFCYLICVEHKKCSDMRV